MIKEIAVVTKEPKYTCVVTNPAIVLDELSLTATMMTVEPDVFVEDNLSADISLVKELAGLHECEPLNIRWRIPDGRSKFEHYNDIVSEAEEVAAMKMFMSTKRFRPNYVIVSSDMIPIFHFCYDYKMSEPDWSAEYTYVAGTYKDILVMTSPALTHHDMIWGVNDERTPGVVAFTKDNKVCYKTANPSNFVRLRLED